MKNNTSFYRKQHVVLWKTTRHFIENNTPFYEEQHAVFRRHFRSIGKTLKLGIRYEKLKNRDHQRYTQERGADCSYSPQSVSNFIVNLLAGMAAYAFYDTKPSINMEFEMEGEAEVKQLTLF